jgi:hypothetical protein
MADTKGSGSDVTDVSSTDTKVSGSGGTSIWTSQLWGVIVVFMGLVVIVIVFFGTLAHFTHANDVVAVIGAVTGVVATLVTAFFGIHATAKAGTDATQKVAAAGADNSQKLVEAGDKAAQAVKDEHNKALAAAAYIPADAAPDFVSKLGI